MDMVADQDEKIAEAAEADGGPEGLELVVELARKAYPDAIPDMIGGASIGEVVASVTGAQEAFARVAAVVEERQAAQVARPPIVPAGGSSGAVVQVEALPAAEKVRRGIAGRR